MVAGVDMASLHFFGVCVCVSRLHFCVYCMTNARLKFVVLTRDRGPLRPTMGPVVFGIPFAKTNIQMPPQKRNSYHSIVCEHSILLLFEETLIQSEYKAEWRSGSAPGS
jgi:hypothetical protein